SRRVRAERRSAAKLAGYILVQLTLPPPEGDSPQGEQKQPQFPRTSLLGERIEEFTLRARRQFSQVGERRAERNVDPGAGVDGPAVGVEDRPEIALADLGARRHHGRTG